MTRVMERMRRVLDGRHVRTHGDYLTVECVKMLEQDNAAHWKAVRAMERARYTPSGRYVLGREVAYVLIAGALMFGLLWWEFSATAAELRDGYRQGAQAARSRDKEL